MRVLVQSLILFVFTSLLSFAFADCSQLQENELSKANLVSLIRNSDCKIKSIEDLLSHLPPSYFQNYALMYRSESLQGPLRDDFLNPRVILYGAFDSRTYMTPPLIVAFGAHTQESESNALEIMETNALAKTENMFKFSEIEFSQNNVRISEANPSKCIRCHDYPAKPILAAYPFWPGSFGSMRFETPDIQKLEVEKYADFVKYSTNHPRYKFLIPIQQPATDSNTFSNLRMKVELLGALLFRGLVERNARIILSSPDYDKIKYSILSGLLRCQNWPNTIPDKQRKELENNVVELFDLDRNMAMESALKVLKNFYEVEGPRELPGLGEFTLDQAHSKLQEHFGPYPVYFRLQADTWKKEKIGRDSLWVASIRMLMEGRGLRIGSWFISLDQKSYHVTDGVLNVNEQYQDALMRLDPQLEIFKSVIEEQRGMLRGLFYGLNDQLLRKNLCDELANKSRDAMKDLFVPRLRTAREAQPGYPQAFVKNCAQCHSAGVDLKATQIPFDSISGMKQWLSNPKNKKSIIDRIDGKDGRPMPPNRWLSPAEKAEIINYLSK